jgi:hypothetical protein
MPAAISRCQTAQLYRSCVAWPRRPSELVRERVAVERRRGERPVVAAFYPYSDAMKVVAALMRSGKAHTGLPKKGCGRLLSAEGIAEHDGMFCPPVRCC